MRRQVDHEMMRNRLIDGMLQTVCEYGLEGLTSKKVSLKSKLNEAYIYRYFFDLEDLKVKAFLKIERDGLCEFAEYIRKYNGKEKTEENLRALFRELWEKITKESVKNIYFVRFLFSATCPEEIRNRYTDENACLLPDDDLGWGSLFVRGENLMTLTQGGMLINLGFWKNTEEVGEKVFRRLKLD